MVGLVGWSWIVLARNFVRACGVCVFLFRPSGVVVLAKPAGLPGWQGRLHRTKTRREQWPRRRTAHWSLVAPAPCFSCSKYRPENLATVSNNLWLDVTEDDSVVKIYFRISS